jgi:hypothetical protein
MNKPLKSRTSLKLQKLDGSVLKQVVGGISSLSFSTAAKTTYTYLGSFFLGADPTGAW